MVRAHVQRAKQVLLLADAVALVVQLIGAAQVLIDRHIVLLLILSLLLDLMQLQDLLDLLLLYLLVDHELVP